MTDAAEALLLPTAQLSPEEREAADKLEAQIDAHIRKSMEFRGADYKGEETRPNVLAEVNQRIKDARFKPEWRYTYAKHPLNAALTRLTGFEVTLAPSDEAYREARKSSLL